MADIRIKDLATTASSTAADDFLAVDGTTNGTRKLSAATPSFATSVTVPGVAGPTATDLTLAGGSTGASLVLGQGANGNVSLRPTNGIVKVTEGGGATSILQIPVAFGNSYVVGGNLNAGVDAKYSYAAFQAQTFQIGRVNDALSSFTETARFTSTGNLLIGTTTDGGQKLQVAGTAYVSGSLTLGSGSGAIAEYLNRGTTAQSSLVQWQTASAANWSVGSGATGTNTNLEFYNHNTASSNFTLNYTTGAATFAGAVTVSSTTAASSTTSGSLINAGGFGNAGKAFFGDQIQVNGGLVSINSVILPAVNYSSLEMNAGTGYLTSYNPVGSVYLPMVIRALSYNFNIGQVTISNTTPSTGAGSGALQVAGGIYAGATSYFGGDLNVTRASAGLVAAQIYNSTSGTGAISGLEIRANNHTGIIYSLSDAFTSSGQYLASGTILEARGSAGLMLSGYASGPVKIWAANGLRATFDASAATFGGTVIAPAATTAISSVRLPHGTAPTSPVNGDMWTTNAGLYVRIAGVTVGPLS